MQIWWATREIFRPQFEQLKLRISALDNIVRAIDAVNGLLVITADHGNADEMLISNQNGNIGN